MKHISCLLVSFALLCSSQIANAEIYHYINDAGRKIYVDRLSQVPPKYKDQLQTRAIKEKNIDAKQQQQYDIENAELAKRMTARNTKRRLLQKLQKIRTQVNISHNKVIVPVNVIYAGKKRLLNLLLDTGATSTVINLDALPNFDTSDSKLSYAQVAGGGLIKTWQVSLANLSFGPVNIDNKQVFMIKHQGNSSSDGLLGMDVLARLDYQIDFNQRHIIWNKDQFTDVQQQISELDSFLKN